MANIDETLSEKQLYERLVAKYNLPEGFTPNCEDFIKAFESYSKLVSLQKFGSEANILIKFLDKITKDCLRNGYFHATSRNNIPMAQACMNMLKSASIPDKSARGVNQIESLPDKLLKLKQSTLPIKENNVTSKPSTSRQAEQCIYERKKERYTRIKNVADPSTESDDSSDVPEFPQQIISDKRNPDSKPIKKNNQALRQSQLSDSSSSESEHLFKPISKRLMVNGIEPVNKNPQSRTRQSKSYDSLSDNSDEDIEPEKSKNKTEAKKSKKEIDENLSKQTNKKSSETLKQSKKNVSAKKGKANNNKSETPDVKSVSDSKFVSRLKQLESSILKGTPDPLGSAQSSNVTRKKPVKPKAQHDTNKKSGATKSKKITAPKKQKKETSKKLPPPKALTPKKNSKKVDTSKKTKAGTNVKDKDNKKAKTKIKKIVNKISDQNKNVEEIIDDKKDNPASFFDSEGDSILGSEPEFGTLSTCMNSIKRKVPQSVNIAFTTPPLKTFLSVNSDAQSDYLTEGSSFCDIPLKTDDKNIVKRMAKANKPKEPSRPIPVPTNKQLTKTPEGLKKVMKMRQNQDLESDFECSSFSDES